MNHISQSYASNFFTAKQHKLKMALAEVAGYKSNTPTFAGFPSVCGGNDELSDFHGVLGSAQNFMVPNNYDVSEI